MKFKPVRSLAVLMAVLMIFMALPAVPASAANVKTIIIKATGLEDLYFYSGDDSFFDAFDNDRLISADSPSGTITINGVVLTASSDNGNVKFTATSNITKNINLSIAFRTKTNSMQYSVDKAEELSDVLVDVIEDQVITGFYTSSILMTFKGGTLTTPWSKISDEEITISLSVPTPEYTVTWTPSNFWGLYNDEACLGEQKQVSGHVTVKQGEAFKFYIKPTNSRQIPLVSATAGSKTISVNITKDQECSTGVYAYQIDSASIDNNIVLTVDLVDPVSVTFNTPAGATVSGNTTIPYGSRNAYTFTVAAKAGFAIDSVTAKYNGEDIGVTAPGGSNEGQYSITAPEGTGFVGSLEITVTVSALTYKVELNVGMCEDADAYTVVFQSHDEVGYNGMFTFTVEAKPGYKAPKVSIVDGNGETADATLSGPSNGNTYTIRDIKENIKIKVEPGYKITYRVDVPQAPTSYSIDVTRNDSAQFVNGGDVPYGTVLTVKVTVKEEYSQSIGSLQLSVNGVPQVASSSEWNTRTYTVTVEAAVNITVSDLPVNKYTVTIPTDTTEYTMGGQTSGIFDYGYDFRFTMTLKPGYKVEGDVNELFGEEIKSKSGNVKISLSDDGSIITVAVTDLNSDLNFAVQQGKIVKKTFTVNKPRGEGYTFTFTSPTDGQSVEVEYGGEITFTVEANTNDGYKIESVSYTMGGSNATTLSPTSGNSYKIPNVTGAVVITVTTSQSFTVTVPVGNTGYTVTGNGTFTVAAETGTVQFTVKLADGYKLNKQYSFRDPPSANSIVKLNGDGDDKCSITVQQDADGKSATYTISNVTGDVTVSIVDEAFAGEKYSVTDSTQANKDGYTISYSDGSEGENISYGSTLTISVKAKDGYEVSHVRYTMGGGKPVEVNDARCFISSVEGDIKLEVDCTVTEYTVVYNFPSVTVCGIQFDHTYISKTYKMTDNDHASRFTGEGSNFAIVLEDFTTLNSDTSFDGCTLNSWSNGQSKVSNVLVGDSRRFEVTADWSVNFTTSATDDGATDTAFGVKEEKVTVQNNGDKVKATCTGSLTTNLKGDLEKLVDGHFTVERCGLVFAAAERNLTTETLNTYRDKVRGLQSSDWLDEGRSDVYCFTYDASNQGMKLGDKFKMNVNSSASGATRFGAVFFLVRFNDGTREVFFGNIQDCSLEVKA